MCEAKSVCLVMYSEVASEEPSYLFLLSYDEDSKYSKKRV